MESYSLRNIVVLIDSNGSNGNNIGNPIVHALVERKASFTSITALIINNKDNSDASKIAAWKEDGVHILEVDFNDKGAMGEALEGQDALVIALEGLYSILRSPRLTLL